MTGFLLALFLALAAAWLLLNAVRVFGRASARTAHLALFALAGVAATIYGGGKGRVGTVSFPRTDPQTAWLSDDGSYVTNDVVHVAFRRVVVPGNAPLFIDRRLVSERGDDSAWIGHVETTFDAFPVPQDIRFEAATNWDWIVYTTWTPGPSVQTNGVWHAVWGKDRKAHRHFIPLRTSVRVDGQVIATPKSKEENK